MRSDANENGTTVTTYGLFPREYAIPQFIVDEINDELEPFTAYLSWRQPQSVDMIIAYDYNQLFLGEVIYNYPKDYYIKRFDNLVFLLSADGKREFVFQASF